MSGTPNENTVDQYSEDDIQEWFEEQEEIGAEPQPSKPEDVGEKYARMQLRVVRETKDYTLDYLQHALFKDGYIINIAPDYQRRQRWSPKKRSQLIESFLMNIVGAGKFLDERHVAFGHLHEHGAQFHLRHDAR